MKTTFLWYVKMLLFLFLCDPFLNLPITCRNQLTYAEINCTGPGANNKERVSWMKKSLNNSEVNEYSLSSFINKDGWLTNIPPISS